MGAKDRHQERQLEGAENRDRGTWQRDQDSEAQGHRKSEVVTGGDKWRRPLREIWALTPSQPCTPLGLPWVLHTALLPGSPAAGPAEEKGGWCLRPGHWPQEISGAYRVFRTKDPLVYSSGKSPSP